MNILEQRIRKELKNYHIPLTEIDFEVNDEIKSILKNATYNENEYKCTSINVLPYVFKLNSSGTYIISLEYNKVEDIVFSPFRDVFINLNLNKIAFTPIDTSGSLSFNQMNLIITKLDKSTSNLLEKELKDLFVTLEMIY